MRGYLGSIYIWKLTFYPRLDKCHRRSQIFPVLDLADYQVSGQINGCSPAEGSKITTEAQCKEACNSLGVTGEFTAGTWNYCPGCFYYSVNGNCHWNTRTDVKWNHANHFEVCKKKEEGIVFYGRV